MTQTIQHTNAAAPYTVLVTISWGSNTARYTRWDEDIDILGEVFTAVPSLSARQTGQSEGGTKPDEVDLTLPVDIAPLTTALLPYKHARVKVKIEEFSPGTNASRRTLFYGTIESIRASASSKLATAKIKGIKAQLAQAKLGVPSLTKCVHTYGRGDCNADIESQKLTATVTTASGVDGSPNRCLLTLSGSPDVANSKFAFGYLEYDGLQLTIRQIADEGTNPDPEVKVDVRDAVPTYWAGKSITVYPGCNKSIEACRDAFRDQESQFLGLGYKMLTYNPGLSDAPQ